MQTLVIKSVLAILTILFFTVGFAQPNPLGKRISKQLSVLSNTAAMQAAQR